MKYLSDEWVDALGEAASRVDVPRDTAAGPIVVQTVVTGRRGDDVAYHLLLHADALAVVRGRCAEPTVTFTQSFETASAVASGTQSAQAAFMAGDIRVGGDVTALIDHRESLALFDQVMADVIGKTEF